MWLSMADQAVSVAGCQQSSIHMAAYGCVWLCMAVKVGGSDHSELLS